MTLATIVALCPLQHHHVHSLISLSAFRSYQDIPVYIIYTSIIDTGFPPTCLHTKQTTQHTCTLYIYIACWCYWQLLIVRVYLSILLLHYMKQLIFFEMCVVSGLYTCIYVFFCLPFLLTFVISANITYHHTTLHNCMYVCMYNTYYGIDFASKFHIRISMFMYVYIYT